MSIIKKIKDYYKNSKNILFTTPSHSQGEFISESAKEMLGEKFFKCDFSEIEGFDNLRNPSGMLKEVQDKIAEIYSAKQSFMLTNGSSSGIVALMMSFLKENDKVLIARNCHISVYNALVLTGAKPVWFMPKFDRNWGIYKGIAAQEIELQLNLNPEIKAVILTSPTYEGAFSNITSISKVTTKFGIKLIVDEAHGALLNFGDFKIKPAILCGADASVQSLHKTAGAPNPCALIHISKKSNLTSSAVQNALNLINTTSPSYPLLLAIEATVEYLDSQEGRKHVKKLLYNIELFKEWLTNSSVYVNSNDSTKILVKIKGVSGYDAAKILNDDLNIEEEYSNNKAMLFITGLGTTKNKLSRLAQAVNKINTNLTKSDKECVYNLPKFLYSPREAYFKEKISVNKAESIGKICGEVIAAYPPGIPVLLPGEIITQDLLPFIKKDEIIICI